MKRQIKLAKELFEVALPNIRNAKKVTEDPRILIFRMFDTEKKHASFVANEFADLTGQIHTFLSLNLFWTSCCIESLMAREKFRISERKVNFFRRLDL